MTRLSLVVPTYNLGAYFNNMLSTVKAQTTDFELWLVDDGSIDNTPQVAADFVNGIADWHAVSLPRHAGISAARNFGLTHATGELIAFVDGDDQLAEDFVATLRQGFDKGPDVAAVAVGYRWWHAPQPLIKGWQALDQAAMFEQVAHHGTPVGGYVWNKAFLRAAIGELRFDEHLRIAEDYWFTSSFVAQQPGHYWYEPKIRYTKVARPGSTIYSAGAGARRQEEQVFSQIRRLEERL